MVDEDFVVCMSLCMMGTLVSAGDTTESIVMVFGRQACVGPVNDILHHQRPLIYCHVSIVECY